MAETDIQIECPLTKLRLIKTRDNLLTRLVKEDKLPIEITGDSNFTFSIALAALRGKWDGITIIDKSDEEHTTFSEVKLLAVKYVIDNGKMFNSEQSEILQQVTNVLATGKDWPQVDKSTAKVVWFQCPWESMRDDVQATYKLMKSFFEKMAKKQAKDDLLLIGIAKTFPHVLGYQLQTLLEHDNETNSLFVPVACRADTKYKFLGYDDELIKQILCHGYKHQSATGDIHFDILHDHITLVFKKKVSTEAAQPLPCV